MHSNFDGCLPDILTQYFERYNNSEFTGHYITRVTRMSDIHIHIHIHIETRIG